MDLSLLVLQVLNGVVLGAIYVLMAAGLSLIFGMLGLPNFAHGALYGLGAYVAFSLLGATGNFWLALGATTLVLAAVGALVESGLLRRLYGVDPHYQILLTFGIALTIQESIILVWGPVGKSVAVPEFASGVVDLGIAVYPAYRVFLAIFVAGCVLVLWYVLERTRFGAVIRAGSEDRQMVSALGIDVRRTFSLVVALGAGLAGLAGALVLPMRGAQPLMGTDILTLTFVVVVIGGMGSFLGAVVGGILVGLVQSLMALYWPSASLVMVLVAMGIVLLVRPQGLFGVR